ncbi:MAG: hypothetical protein IPI41_12220 [Flavobacteriales bacterium]|nr:hypothetical protein [Flavobacteriales bacterium]
MNAFAAVSSVLAPFVHARILLEGPYDVLGGLMNDALRSQGLVPTAEPFTALGYLFAVGGGEITTTNVLGISGNNAIVDWVILELRSAQNAGQVVYSRAALLQRDGDVVDLDGISPVRCGTLPGSYHLALRHRNHLGICTAGTWNLGPVQVTTIDLTTAQTAVFGTDARKPVGNFRALWAGDVTFNNQLKYAGSNNDRDPILTAIGGTVPTNTLSGQYRQEDINMNGQVKYAGSANDRDILLQNIGGSVPTAVRNAQLP